jgi:hypothetical protein
MCLPLFSNIGGSTYFDLRDRVLLHRFYFVGHGGSPERFSLLEVS